MFRPRGILVDAQPLRGFSSNCHEVRGAVMLVDLAIPLDAPGAGWTDAIDGPARGGEQSPEVFPGRAGIEVATAELELYQPDVAKPLPESPDRSELMSFDVQLDLVDGRGVELAPERVKPCHLNRLMDAHVDPHVS